ncbi:PucR family transcriptional regulator [Pseudonocardia oroxyli]|uniref:PucR C-terminal helix-turn-helix domain-containing protein n=1 Tax=Pseudonocardia oroxyli TaxID=366584 RepID=A0A1G8DWT6_PSEOR|nr:helix-turn-helix domain-containing protein [Pseudonocardia oroxyli]SDH61909.1 PucR C-terminal helix-turn-helix domain-containing protein [Pseudonocardia oroxyli]
MSDVDDSVRAATRAVAETMLPELPAIGRETAEAVSGAMPELAQPQVVNMVLTASHANSAAVLDALLRSVRLDEMAPSPEVILATRGLVRANISQTSLVRGYQVGTAHWCDRWSRTVELNCADPALALRVARHGTAFLLAWLQVITERLVGEFRDEAEQVMREGSMARLAEVRRVLTDDDIDVVAMSQRLGYDLRGHHVAVVLHRTGEAETAMEATSRTLAGALTSSWPLVVQAEADTVWCWIPTRADCALPPPGASMSGGQGRPGKGLDGFRQSHRQAREALRIALLREPPTDHVLHFDDIELVALCSGDQEAYRTFVDTELGALAADDPHTQRLRTTLQAFYEANSNFRATAARLGLHHNTIRYRLDQAAELLGRPTTERRLQLELALHLHASPQNLARNQGHGPSRAGPGDR